LNGEISELVWVDRYLVGIFSLVLLRNVTAELVSEDLVLSLRKKLLVASLLSKLCINLSLLFRGYLRFWLIFTRRTFHKRRNIFILRLLFVTTTIGCRARTDLYLWCTPASGTTPFNDYWLDLSWLIRFFSLLDWVCRRSVRVAIIKSFFRNESVWPRKSAAWCSPTSSRRTTT
jgi:hypothetical protein